MVPEDSLRSEPAPLVVRTAGLDPSSPSAQSADQASLAQRQAELAELGATNSALSDGAISSWLDRLLAGQVAKELQLDVLEAAGKHARPAIQAKLQAYRAARLAEGGLATSAELLYGGNAERGRKLFLEKPQLGCIKCHKVGSEGGELGPPLTGGLTNRTREFILESILQPNAQITPGYEMVTVILRNRHPHTGVIRRETDSELTLACPPDEDTFQPTVVTVKKAEVAVRRKAPSPMPDGLEKSLSPGELRDVIEYVASLNPEGRSTPQAASTAHPN